MSKASFDDSADYNNCPICQNDVCEPEIDTEMTELMQSNGSTKTAYIKGKEPFVRCKRKRVQWIFFIFNPLSSRLFFCFFIFLTPVAVCQSMDPALHNARPTTSTNVSPKENAPIVPKNTKKGAQRRKPSLSSNGPIKGLNGQNNGWKKKPRMATNTPRQKKKMSPTPKRLSDGYLLPSKHEWHRSGLQVL